MNNNSKIFVAGGTGLVGSSFLRKLTQEGFNNIVSTFKKRTPTDEYNGSVRFVQLDLINQNSVDQFFSKERPEYVFLAAAKVGGIHANNTYKADFIYENLMIAANVIHSSFKYKAAKLLNLGSSCIYPKMAPQPLKEEYLLSGPLETTNEPYAVAKISAIKLCRYFNEQYNTNFISVMPTNLYGPHDNYDLENSHVLPALIRKFHDAKTKNASSVTIWGTGTPYREFLYSDDLADACLFIMKRYNAKEIGELINIGTGTDVTIKELASIIKKIVKYEGEIVFDATKPDGTFRKLMDISKLSDLGWTSKVELKPGIQKAYEHFLKEVR